MYKVYYFMYNQLCSRLFDTLNEAVDFANNKVTFQSCAEIVRISDEKLLDLFEVR